LNERTRFLGWVALGNNRRRAASATTTSQRRTAIDRGDATESSQAHELSNVVEGPLAKALGLAAEAKQWDIVILIAEELRRRPEPRTGERFLRQHVR